MLKFNLNCMYFELFMSSRFLGFTRTEKPENTRKTQNKFDNLLSYLAQHPLPYTVAPTRRLSVEVHDRCALACSCSLTITIEFTRVFERFTYCNGGALPVVLAEKRNIPNHMPLVHSQCQVAVFRRVPTDWTALDRPQSSNSK